VYLARRSFGIGPAAVLELVEAAATIDSVTGNAVKQEARAEPERDSPLTTRVPGKGPHEEGQSPAPFHGYYQLYDRLSGSKGDDAIEQHLVKGEAAEDEVDAGTSSRTGGTIHLPRLHPVRDEFSIITKPIQGASRKLYDDPHGITVFPVLG
jgi:hypothetical protein